MQFCPTCGAQQPGQFCRGCGADLRNVRTALQSPPGTPDTARLELARAVSAKIAAIDPNDAQLVTKIAFLRQESQKLLESPEDRRRMVLPITIGAVGGGALFFFMTLLTKIIQSGDRTNVEGLLILMLVTLLATLASLVLTSIFPRNLKAVTNDLPVSFQAGTGRPTPTAEIQPPQPMLGPPSVTEETTHQLSREAVPVSRHTA